MENKSDKAINLFAIRSLLFLPASNPRAIARARETGADFVILDLEDAVKPADKINAREAAIKEVAEPWPMPVAIRINGAGSEWHDSDVDSVARSVADFIVIPRAISAQLIGDIAKSVDKPVLAMIETTTGVLAAPQIAREAIALIAGTNDLRADLRVPFDLSRASISTSLQLIVLAARAAGIAVFDGVFNKLDDDSGFLAEAGEGYGLGFDGKSIIHPSQIIPCNRAFSPSSVELEQAHRLIAAFQGGAERFEDRMIERMHVETAKRMLERAKRIV